MAVLQQVLPGGCFLASDIHRMGRNMDSILAADPGCAIEPAKSSSSAINGKSLAISVNRVTGSTSIVGEYLLLLLTVQLYPVITLNRYRNND